MKRTAKSVLCFALCVAMGLTSPNAAAFNGVSATAKGAVKIRLNSKKIVIKVGQKKKLTLKGVSKKQLKAVKFKTSNKKIAIVGKRGIVRGKRAGKCKITAIFKRKKYVCNVIVKKAGGGGSSGDEGDSGSSSSSQPKSSATADVSAAPGNSSNPSATVNVLPGPVTSAEAQSTSTPEKTARPIETSAGMSFEPVVFTKKPSETTVPLVTKTPSATQTPAVTETPEATEKPVSTNEAEETVKPEDTTEPEETIVAEESTEPEESAEPEETTDAEESAEPEDSIEPEETTLPLEPETDTPEDTADVGEPTSDPEDTPEPEAETPKGKISITEGSFWETLLSVITFGNYKADNEVTIEATNESEEVRNNIEISYYIFSYQTSESTSALTKEELDKITFSPYTSAFKLADENSVVYAKLVNKEDTSKYIYISSNGITIENVEEVIKPSSITLEQYQYTIDFGQTTNLTATVLPEDAANKSVKWEVDDTSIISIDAGGKVTTAGIGTTKARAVSVVDSNVKSQDVTFTVNEVKVSEITLNASKRSLVEGNTANLSATSILPSNATNKTITWSSSDENVATVDSNGKVTAVKEGEAVITAKAGNAEATCTINVEAKEIVATDITLTSTTGSQEVDINGTLQLKAATDPENTTDTITWISSDETIATVDNGIVTALSSGTVTITAKANNNVYTTITITVTEEEAVVEAESVSLSNKNITINNGAETSLTATVYPEDAVDKSVTFTSSDANVVKVTDNGDGTAKLTATGKGTATVTAKTANGKTATCNVTVNEPVENVTIEQESVTLLIKDGNYGSETLKTSVLPENASDQTLTFTSSNTKVAKVDSEGNVTAVSRGKAVITASSNNGKTDTCEVNVYVPGTAITIPEEVALVVGGNSTIAGSITPGTNDEDSASIKYSSDNSSVATIDGNGKITAVAEGTANITASFTSKYTGDTYTSGACKVTVTKEKNPVKTLTMDTSKTVNVGDAVKLSYTATGEKSGAVTDTFTWSSSDGTVATVDASGNVTGIKKGSAKITI
ncbi:MAG: Ig-like domain-containing protein, partial [Lachnospiraceae bacterium]|nr:Ig-like domain-containing protein [Lachnospiraceae bacterium]